MTEPRRSDRLPLAADVPERDREARVEELLLAGLDHYFAEQHELAINVWTRVLFIDRGHARARAYIERARSAIAERQRQGDELLHTGNAAFDRGDAAAARELVRAAVEHGASLDEALALLARIDRLENAAQAPLPLRRSEPQPAPGGAGVMTQRRARLRWIGGGIVAGMVLCAVVLTLILGGGTVVWPLLGGPEAVAVSTLNAPLPVPSIAEIALSRGEALYAKGHLREALAALQAVPAGDPLRRRADDLTAAIQRQLLATMRSGSLARPEAPSRRP
jgi:tetratricopeptide (TPR) repeat protein